MRVWVCVCVMVGRDTGYDVAYTEVGCVLIIVCVLCLLVISLGYNRIDAVGAGAIGAGLHGLPLLEYVMQAWVMCMMGRGQAEWCDGARTGGVV